MEASKVYQNIDTSKLTGKQKTNLSWSTPIVAATVHQKITNSSENFEIAIDQNTLAERNAKSFALIRMIII